MALKLSDAKSQRMLAPAGTHLALCYSVVDLGTHTEDGKFGKKTNRKIRVTWELPDEKAVFKEGEPEKPHSVSKTYNFTMGEKATLRKDLEAWRSKPFTPAEMDAFELQKLVGQFCMVTVKHGDKDGTTYDNVEGVTSVPKAMKNAILGINPTNALLYYEVSYGEGETFDRLHDWMKEMVRSSKEWAGGEPSKTHAPDFGDGNDNPDGPDCPF